MTVVAVLSTFIPTIKAQETAPAMHITLDKAIELALSENPTIKVAEKEIELKEVSKTEAWQNLLPTVSINGTVAYNIKVAEIAVFISNTSDVELVSVAVKAL